MTGETANGRSIKDSRRFRPRKLNLAMHPGRREAEYKIGHERDALP